MRGGRFLLLFSLLVLSSLIVLATALPAADSHSARASDKAPTNTADSPTTKPPDAPPVAEPKPVVDIYHGTKVVDNYRWLENGNSPETQKWVEEEMDYTR